MKRTLIITLCAVMTLLLGACGSKADTAQKANSEKNAQIPNPFIDCETIDEAVGIAGFEMTVPEEISGYDKPVINAIENEMIQVIYYKDEDEIRIRKGAGSEDISGDYNEYANTDTISVEGMQVKIRGNDGTVSVATWTNEKYSYSITVDEGITADSMTDFIKAVQ